jgi:hypothetical protein
MKLTLLLLALAISVSAQVAPKTTYFGDRSRGEFYPVGCSSASSIPSENWIVFDSRDDAERKGYQFMPCPVTPRVTKVKKVRAVTQPPASRPTPVTIVMITSEPSKWLGRSVMVRSAALTATDVLKFDDNTYAFRVSDGASGFYVYMNKRAAASLRDLTMKNTADGVAGNFTVYLDPKAYQSGSDVYGRLVAYSLKAN